MQHKGTVRLETDRLILRRFRLDDSGAAFQNWTSDKRVTEFLRWPAHDTVNTTKKILQTWVDLSLIHISAILVCAGTAGWGQTSETAT